jgi:predicted dehydrogenase
VIHIGVIGYGYWGPNVVRNLNAVEGFRVAAIADMNHEALHRAKRSFPQIETTTDPDAITRSASIDAVAIVTPVWTHYGLAKTALANGKHVFVEKPFTATTAEAEDLIDLSSRKGLIIMVDHTFLFTSAVQKIRELVRDDVLGKLYYYDALRVNLGLFQHDINVVWDLAPHDLSIMEYVIGDEPEAIMASGEIHVNGHEDVAFLTVYYPERVIGHINVNWLSPVKVRSTLIGGEKKMLVWNDMLTDEKLKIYDRGVNANSPEGVHQLRVSYRSGDLWSPKLGTAEALECELSYFRQCIDSNTTPINDGIAGWRVVRMLEAATKSMKLRGAPVLLGATGLRPTGSLAAIA